MADGRIVGVLTLRDLQLALGRQGETGAGGRGHAARACPRSTRTRCWTPPSRRCSRRARAWARSRVTGRVVGLVTLDNVGEFIMVQSSLNAHLRRHPQG